MLEISWVAMKVVLKVCLTVVQMAVDLAALRDIVRAGLWAVLRVGSWVAWLVVMLEKL